MNLGTIYDKFLTNWHFALKMLGIFVKLCCGFAFFEPQEGTKDF